MGSVRSQNLLEIHSQGSDPGLSLVDWVALGYLACILASLPENVCLTTWLAVGTVLSLLSAGMLGTALSSFSLPGPRSVRQPQRARH